MAITINKATLARQVNGEIEYVYPKTTSDLVEYDASQNVKEKIDSMANDIKNVETSDSNKINKPLDSENKPHNGTAGYVLETNGDGTTSWVHRARVYVGSDEMPEGYDVQIDPNGTSIDLDRTLSKDGAVAEASAVGAAVKNINKDIANKVNIPIDKDGKAFNGTAGYVLETNGDGTTSWVQRARVYVGSGEMPEGYDVQIDPNATTISIDKTLSVSGGVAEASAVGKAIEKIYEDMNAVDNGTKIDKPLDSNNNPYDGTAGQILKSNGDGSTSWVDNTIAIDIDDTLSKDGEAAEAAAVGEAINRLYSDITDIENTLVSKPVDSEDNPSNGIAGYVLETNGDGTTSWVHRARVYVGSDEMPEGYDVQIDPNATTIEIDRTLSVDGAVAEASAVGAAIKNATEKARDYMLLRDPVTGCEYIVKIQNGSLVCTPKAGSIVVSKEPTKVKYSVGDVFSPEGMVVSVVGEDGSIRNITDFTYSKEPLTEGTTFIEITYTENDSIFTVRVPIEVISHIDPDEVLQDFEYEETENGTYKLTGWKGTFNGEDSTKCIIPPGNGEIEI